MNQFTLIGIKNNQYIHFKNEISKALTLLDEPYQLTEVNALDAIVDSELESIPALLVNNKLVIVVNGYLPDTSEIFQSLTKAISPITSSGSIIIPIDFSVISKNAFVYGQDIANHYSQSIHVIHVTPSIGAQFGFTDPFDIKTKNIRKFVEQNTISNHLKITTELVKGNILNGIIKSAQKVDTDFIVMGTTGKTNNAFLGSISRKLSLNDLYPTFLIPDTSKFTPFSRVVFAGHINTQNQKLVEKLSESELFSKSEISIVEVQTKQNTEFREISSKKSKKYWNILIQDEDVVSGLITFLKKNNADLLIMYKPSKPFWQTTFRKSMTKKIHNEIKIPLLLLH